jgi:hypothetical protein
MGRFLYSPEWCAPPSRLDQAPPPPRAKGHLPEEAVQTKPDPPHSAAMPRLRKDATGDLMNRPLTPLHTYLGGLPLARNFKLRFGSLGYQGFEYLGPVL